MSQATRTVLAFAVEGLALILWLRFLWWYARVGEPKAVAWARRQIDSLLPPEDA